MKGFIAKTVATICLAGSGVMGIAGCYTYHDIVDPCYPQRYEYEARASVRNTVSPQVANGHILDQTVWNYHFESGTARLTAGGREHLVYLSRRRPCPDPTVYLQVAHDIAYDPANSEKFAEARNSLDAKRMQVVLDFLNAQTAGRNVTFDVVRHDPGDVSLSAASMNESIRKSQAAAQGILIRPAVGGAGGGR